MHAGQMVTSNNIRSNMSLSHHAVLFYDIPVWSVHVFCYPLVLYVVTSCPHVPPLWIHHPWLYAPVSHCFPLLSCPSVWSTVFDPFDCEFDRLSFAPNIWPPPYRTVFTSLKPYLWILNCRSCAFESRELRLWVRVKETHIRAKSRMGWLCKICLIILAQATNLLFSQCFFCCPTSNIPAQYNMFHSRFLFLRSYYL